MAGLTAVADSRCLEPRCSVLSNKFASDPLQFEDPMKGFLRSLKLEA